MKLRILLIAVAFFALVGSFMISSAQERSDRAPFAPSIDGVTLNSAIPPAPSAEQFF